MHSLFVTPRSFIEPGIGGGVQWCTNDYLRTLRAAGFETEILTFDFDRRLSARVLRGLARRPFAHVIPPAFLRELIRICQRNQPITVFLNNTCAFALAPPLRRALGENLRIVLLSHGVENTDLVNALRIAPQRLPAWMRHPSWLGRTIHEEIKQRQAVDLVVCISAEDVLFEQWIGAPECIFLPRSIDAADLPWRPRRGRIGSVATLDHEPNLQGLRQLCGELEGQLGLTLRLVGGPVDLGKQLECDFRMVEYCGRLSDKALRAEASSWAVLVNPIFCQARGASTKVATALAWGLPVATTVVGARGYRWDDALLPRTESKAELVRLCLEMSRGDLAAWQERARGIRALAPSFAESGERLADCLRRLQPSPHDRKLQPGQKGCAVETGKQLSESFSTNHEPKRERVIDAGGGLALAEVSSYEECVPGLCRGTVLALLNTAANLRAAPRANSGQFERG